MQGLELSKKYYEQYGEPMLREQFADVLPRIAVGLCGEGSECLGYDDAISRDHDFEPGFCLWLTDEDERDFGFRLERAYAKLPKEFEGVKRPMMSPVGGNRRGVLKIGEFYEKFLGAPTAPDTVERWLYTPSAMLRTASNGEVWRDELGAFSAVRNVLLQGYPEDIRRKKLAAHLFFMAQSGQYNFERCARRGETGAAQMAIASFVQHAISAVFLLNGQYAPFYKWAYRAMRDLPKLGDLADGLAALTELGNSEAEIEGKLAAIEDTAVLILDECRAQGLSKATCRNFETHAYSVQDSISDADLRNRFIGDGAETIIP
ncbi:MAG: DUF4037 domain-containing protein [Oscillospiraceae bacterium]|nr:DUF4037 domain-containing protein [Oscillospiraceae bacterium]